MSFNQQMETVVEAEKSLGTNETLGLFKTPVTSTAALDKELIFHIPKKVQKLVSDLTLP